MFSNGDVTDSIRISDSKKLDSKAIWNLSKFFEYNEKLKSTKSIKVPENATELRDQLINLGYRVESSDGNITYT